MRCVEFLNLVSAVAGYQVSQPYMSVFSEEDETTGNGGGHFDATCSSTTFFTLLNLGSQGGKHYHRLRGRKSRSVCDRINELKKVPSQLIED